MIREAVLDCGRRLFLLRDNGPHRSGLPTVAELPTREEISIAQDALKEVLGEKGSERSAPRPTSSQSAGSSTWRRGSATGWATDSSGCFQLARSWRGASANDSL